MATLQQLPAAVVLERFPVPALAMAVDGSVVFANAAFAEMLGSSRKSVARMRYPSIFCNPPAEEFFIAAARRHAETSVELRHSDGSIVDAKMSKSATVRGDDPVVLTTFEDQTERLWICLSRWADDRCSAAARFDRALQRFPLFLEVWRQSFFLSPRGGTARIQHIDTGDAG